VGFERTKHLNLTWPEDHELAGLEVTMRRLSIGDMKRLAKMADESTEESFTFLSKRVANSIVTWNVTENGNPVDPSPEYLDDDFELTGAILANWMGTAGSVSDPLESKSTVGSSSGAELTAMESLSTSPLS